MYIDAIINIFFSPDLFSCSTGDRSTDLTGQVQQTCQHRKDPSLLPVVQHLQWPYRQHPPTPGQGGQLRPTAYQLKALEAPSYALQSSHGAPSPSAVVSAEPQTDQGRDGGLPGRVECLRLPTKRNPSSVLLYHDLV